MYLSKSTIHQFQFKFIWTATLLVYFHLQMFNFYFLPLMLLSDVVLIRCSFNYYVCLSLAYYSSIFFQF